MHQHPPPATVYRIRDPKHFHRAMRDDVTLLRSHRAHVSLATIIVCCIDALAAGTGKASKGKFEAYANEQFPDLCRALGAARSGKNGAKLLYDNFRNGFAHLRGPKARFAIAENGELNGEWAGTLSVDSVGDLVAINIDRLTDSFLSLLARLDTGAV